MKEERMDGEKVNKGERRMETERGRELEREKTERDRMTKGVKSGIKRNGCGVKRKRDKRMQ